MSSYKCGCGFVMKSTSAVEDFIYVLIPNRVVSDTADLIDEGVIKNLEDFYSKIDPHLMDVWKCPQCGRLHIEEEKPLLTSYIKEVSS
jgi:hypothetical protein